VLTGGTVVLGEAEGVHETATLQRLPDTDALTGVVVVHDPDHFLAAVKDHVWSAFHAPLLHMKTFATDELADILAAQAQRGLRLETQDRALLRTVVDRADDIASQAIQTLRSAAAEASDWGDDRLTADILEAAEDRAQRRILRYSLETLPYHHRLLYELVRQDGPLAAG